MMEERKSSLLKMMEEEAMKPVFGKLQEEGQSAKEQLRELISALRHLPEGKYHEVVTADFELTLEYHEKTVLISLYTVEGNNFRRLICDEGYFSLTAEQIFVTVQSCPQSCCVDGSQLVVGEDVRIELKQVALGEATKLKIKFSRFIRKYLQKGGKMKPFEEPLLKKFEELQRLEELKKRLEESPKSFIVDTPDVARFLIESNNITYNMQANGFWYQVLLGVVLERARPFVLCACITNTFVGDIVIGVVDRLVEKQRRSSYNSGNAVCYYGGDGLIYYGTRNNREYKWTQIGVRLQKGAKVRMEVELEKGLATFIIGGKKFTQHSDILSQPYRQFVPYFQMGYKGESVCWRIE